MDYRITQCPRCGTSFRVTEAHLAVAAGAVRCGSCLHIFNAREHWVEEQTAEDDEQEQVLLDDEALEQQVLAANGPDDEPVDDDGEMRYGDENDDDLLFSDDPSEQEPVFFTSDDDRLLFVEEPTSEQTLTPTPITDAGALSPDFLDATGWTPEPKIQLDQPAFDDEPEHHDDSWAEGLLVDDTETEEEEHARTPAPASDPLFDEFDDILASAPLAIDEDDDLGEPERPEPQRDTDDWTPAGDDPFDVRPAATDRELQLSAEFLSLGELGRSASRDSTGIADGSNLSPEWQRVLGSDDVLDTPTAAQSDEPLRADERIGDDGAPPGRGRQLLGSFEPEPLQLHRFVREPRWPKVLWALGLLAGVVLLVGQYLYFNFPVLARGEQRPLMAQLCGLVGCTLPPQHDLAAIRTSSLIVRSHPTQRGALAVDAILTNTASFRQPYPNLLLQFTDINGEAVAGGIFSADDYLGGELAGDAQMPIQQQIHIELVIADPGQRAQNYQLSVVPPQQP